MKMLSGCALLVTTTLLIAGCPISPSTITVELVNDGDFPVAVTIYIHDDQLVLDSLIDDFGTELTYTVAAGNTTTFSYACDELQAIKIGDADLQVIAGFGPETDSITYRDGTHFGCGDTITFTFTHDDFVIPTELDVAFTQAD